MIKYTLPYLQTLRLHQWSKNSLIFVPSFISHQIVDLTLLKLSIILFIAQGFASSGTYIINDILDKKTDEFHPDKKHRPIAAGKIPLSIAWVYAGLFIAGSIFIGSLVSPAIPICLAGYIVMSCFYSTFLKKMVVLDLVLLSFFYIYRILLGHVGLDIPFSMWLLTFSFFIFFGLATSKRIIELEDSPQNTSSKKIIL